MTDDVLHQIETQLVGLFAGIDGIELALPNEPGEISVGKLPAVTLKWTGLRAVDYETGGGQDVAHTWRIYLYVEARKLTPTWEELKTLGVKIARALRDDPTLNDLAEITSFRTEEEPDVVQRGSQKLGQMTFLLTVTGVDEF